MQFLLGSQTDVVSVLVSTSLSEFWAVGPGGCQESKCLPPFKKSIGIGVAIAATVNPVAGVIRRRSHSSGHSSLELIH